MLTDSSFRRFGSVSKGQCLSSSSSIARNAAILSLSFQDRPHLPAASATRRTRQSM